MRWSRDQGVSFSFDFPLCTHSISEANGYQARGESALGLHMPESPQRAWHRQYGLNVLSELLSLFTLILRGLQHCVARSKLYKPTSVRS